jgi:hypothetical protein
VCWLGRDHYGSFISIFVKGDKKKKKKEPKVVIEMIKFKLSASLQELAVEFTTAKARISTCALKGINADIMVKDSYTQINARLNQIAIVDLNPDTIHNLVSFCFKKVSFIINDRFRFCLLSGMKRWLPESSCTISTKMSKAKNPISRLI